MNNDLVRYYKERANEYERIYSKPERQDDLKQSTVLLQDLFANEDLLEIACGTGFWTERIAQTAHSVLATDINETVIGIARKKEIANPKVIFSVADLYHFKPEKQYPALFGGFIWSHILRQDLDHFLETTHALVKPGGRVVWMDNNYVPGSNHPVTHTDEHGNTFQTRQLDDGSAHRVLKNFPTEIFLKEKLKGIAIEINITTLTYFWILSYRTRKQV